MAGQAGDAPPLLLDTCALIWLAEGAPMKEEALAMLRRIEEARKTIFVSPISAWEIGLLMARGRIISNRSAQAWFADLMAHPLLELAAMPPELLIDSSALPGDPPNDPADRIIIATARQYGLTIMTRDGIILDYAKNGFVRALAC